MSQAPAQLSEIRRKEYRARAIQFLAPGGTEEALAEAMVVCATAPETLPAVALKHGIELLP